MDKQPFKFRLVQADGSTVEGGAESRDLCIDHIEQCIINGGPNRVVKGYYLGKHGQDLGSAYAIRVFSEEMYRR